MGAKRGKRAFQGQIGYEKGIFKFKWAQKGQATEKISERLWPSAESLTKSVKSQYVVKLDQND